MVVSFRYPAVTAFAAGVIENAVAAELSDWLRERSTKVLEGSRFSRLAAHECLFCTASGVSCLNAQLTFNAS
jgi:hypothetical protein